MSLDDQINHYLQKSFTPEQVHAFKAWLDRCSEAAWQAAASSLKIAATEARQSADGRAFTLDVAIMPNGEPRFQKVFLS